MKSADILIMTREQLEQALQGSEMQEIRFNAKNDVRLYGIKNDDAWRRAIIDRLFMWQRVNNSLAQHRQAELLKEEEANGQK